MKRQLVNVSPFVLASACTLLALIIGSFAATNYNREKRLMEAALLQKGESVLRFVNSGLRVSMQGFMMGGEERRVNWSDHVQVVIDQAMEDEDISFIQLVDRNGIIKVASDASRVGQGVDDDTISFLQLASPGSPAFRMRSDSGELEGGFQVAQGYEPRAFRAMGRHGMMRGRGSTELSSDRRGELERFQEEMARFRGLKYTLLVELDLQAYNSALKRQIVQIVVLSVVLLLVGIGGWLSLLTLQGLKGSQARLRQIREFNDILVESLPVGLIATDGDGRIQIINDAAGGILGVDSSTLLDTEPAAYLPDDVAASLIHAKDSSRGDTAEKTIRTPDGSEQSLLLTSLNIAGEEGGQVGAMLLLQDVSELRGLESQLRRTERLAALGKMAAGVAHELRNPLSSIKGLALVLKEKVEGVSGQQAADILVEEVERLNRSIGELLDYARPEKMDLKITRLGWVVENTVELMQHDAEQQSVELTYDVATDRDDVLADEDKLKQVLLNIVLNSLQAIAGEGRVCLHVDRDGADVICTITDSGQGVAGEDLPRVFDPYFTTKSTGTGLGLAISAKIIEEHSGRISMESTAGAGTVVMVRLPYYSGHETS